MINRRAFITGLGAVLAASLGAEAQQAAKVYRIGFLRSGQPPESYIEGFRHGLREWGYVDGRDVVVEFRATDGSLDQLPQLAEELVRLKVDVIVASAATAALAVKRATASVPIVFVGVVDPVELGLVPSLGRPGGNITGLATNSADVAGKRLELLRATVPRLRRVAVLWHPANPTNPLFHNASRSLRRAGGPEQAACDLWTEGVCRCRRPHVIWHGLSRLVQTCSPLCGQDLEGREAG
jgi:ABC-type uncharacterized transport system substrate-binding protein